MPDSSPALPSGEQIQAHLEGYARHFEIDRHIRFGCEVLGIAPRQGGHGWVVTCREGGRQERREYDFVIVAAGLCSHPLVPELPDRERFRGTVVHSSEYHDAGLVRGRKVLGRLRRALHRRRGIAVAAIDTPGLAS